MSLAAASLLQHARAASIDVMLVRACKTNFATHSATRIRTVAIEQE